MASRIVVLPDFQMPFEDRKFVKALINCVGYLQPDRVVHIGDLMDYPSTGRWNKDARGEFENNVYKHSEYGIRNFLKPLRDVYNGPVTVMEGNHDLRPREYLNKYAPALAGTRAFDLDVLLDFDSFGVELNKGFLDFAPGWTITHGHLARISLAQSAGATALGAAVNKFHKSVIMGHTHRAGMLSKTFGYDGKIARILTGIEVGHAMDMKGAEYLKRSTGNWQQALLVLHVDGSTVLPHLSLVKDRKFEVDGEIFRV
jgi:metallophosphoesterase superfamily enzyme